MPATEAQKKANQLNAQRSTGPKTAEGKANSRRNALKHGLTGAGVVMPDGDHEAVDARAGRLIKELKPTTELGEFMVRHFAILSVRLTRCVEQSVDLVNTNIDKALRRFEVSRFDEADHLFEALPTDPSVILRSLLRTEEGTRRLIDGWTDLKTDLVANRWKPAHALRLAHLKGYRPDDCGIAYVFDLFDALKTRPEPAKNELMAILDEEIESLTGYIAEIDPAEYERDRDEAIARAKLDMAADAYQIQQYEAATERSMFRTLKEARLAEKAPTLIEQAKTIRVQPSAATPGTETASNKSASFSENRVGVAPIPPSQPSAPPSPDKVKQFEALLAQHEQRVETSRSATQQIGQTVTAKHPVK